MRPKTIPSPRENHRGRHAAAAKAVVVSPDPNRAPPFVHRAPKRQPRPSGEQPPAGPTPPKSQRRPRTQRVNADRIGSPRSAARTPARIQRGDWDSPRLAHFGWGGVAHKSQVGSGQKGCAASRKQLVPAGSPETR
jgi:hypothetical protein